MSEKYAVMPMDDYVSACDTIKDKTGAEDNHILSGELPEKIDEVFEAGKQAYYDWFWDTFQKKGTVAIDYSGAFQTRCWTDETYNPKYRIYPTGANQLFYSNTGITDTKVEIDLTKQTNNRGSLFYGCSKMVTIRKIKSLANQGWTDVFKNCSSLKNVTHDGEIGRSISYASSPLTPESMISVIEHLVNYAGTSSDHTYTVTFTDACWTALEAYRDAPSEATWRDYVDIVLGWNT